MSAWHLRDAQGRILRSTEASTFGQARFRLAPIPTGGAVVPAAAPRQARTVRQRATGVAPLVLWEGFGRGNHGDVYARWFILAGNVRGLNDHEIAGALGTSPARVQQIRQRLKVPSFHARRAMAVRAYHALGWGNTRIALRVGMHAQHVSTLLRKLGLASNRRRGGDGASHAPMGTATDYLIVDPYRGAA